MKGENIGFIIILITIILLMISPLPKINIRECVKYEEYEYYDSSGTALYVATNNAGFLAQNGYEKGHKCVKYK